jgi:hypothetical protein
MKDEGVKDEGVKDEFKDSLPSYFILYVIPVSFILQPLFIMLSLHPSSFSLYPSSLISEGNLLIIFLIDYRSYGEFEDMVIVSLAQMVANV